MNKIRFISLTASVVLAITFTLSCEDKEVKDKPAEAVAPPIEAAEAPKEGTFTDPRDGKKYKFVRIGEQVWMAENLNFAVKGSKCYGEDDEVVIGYDEEMPIPITKTLSETEVQANCDKYGRLYDWETALKACPSGWHLPSKAEWEVLDKAVGGEKVAGKKLKSSSGWNDNNGKPGNGTDEFGFSALPGGGGSSGGYFDDVGNQGTWWTATEYDSNGAYIRIMNYGYDLLNSGNSFGESLVFSVRCVQD